ncbi:hypothetical protein SPRG_04156 [Saprolegnia parasitica CBS 223.65]|uniref:Uncharacterized protein n=1 Tax=Saprolegnia parasitica (strain CBS 223.65) TaxID=695850 RepID=A0A067CKB4_SAPPC|nr:hypothetical protein SPRG_04156 [Saprolegnia parasitica CBS 223.65]KDO30968.1 hypothetical protein SPRG_04156 [Saprolegnia parasitica CBS 223.65]|eukprot:XP_012198152.1 hypothetical protein SPRG_04156 [Saprolegnia parasitica CBS 223.65]
MDSAPSALQAVALAAARDDVADDNIQEALPETKETPHVPAPPADDPVDDLFGSDDDEPSKPAERVLAPRPTSLVDVAKESSGTRPSLLQVAQQDVSQRAPSLVAVARDGSSRKSLMDVAAESTAAARSSLIEAVANTPSASETLLGVAKTVQLQHQSTIATVLGKVADDDRRASDRHITQTLRAAATEVTTQRHVDAGATLATAAAEVRADRASFAYNHSDAKVDVAVDILVRQPTLSPKKAPQRVVKSVDRAVLQSRQSHGLKHSGPLLKSRKDQLSSYQHDHLTATQKRLLYATLVEHKPPSKRDNQTRMAAIERMATPIKPKRLLGKEKYAREDDRKHCRFKPRLGRGSHESGGRSDDDDETDNQDFIRRMEAAEKAKNESIRRNREERAYIAQLDKKECPKCGNLQSYSEVKQKRKQCPNCGVAYRSRMAWGDVESDFFTRVSDFESHKASRRVQVAAATTPPFVCWSGKVLDPQTHTITTQRLRPLTWKDVEADFLGRVQLDEMNRILNREELEREFYGSFTFHPSITPHAKRMTYARFEERMQRDIDDRASRLAQYELRAKHALSYEV